MRLVDRAAFRPQGDAGQPREAERLPREIRRPRTEIISLNANGNPLHPTDPAQGVGLRNTIRVAGEMEITTVCTMSGLPAGSPEDQMPNWVVSSWPSETQAILRYQWEEKLIPFWAEIVALAKENGVERIALELHGDRCVYNVPSPRKLRAAVGPVIGANLDPSHLFWMGRTRCRRPRHRERLSTTSMPSTRC